MMGRLKSLFPLEDEREQRTVREFIEAYRAADIRRFVDAMGELEYVCRGWSQALRGTLKSPVQPDHFRRLLLDMWRHHGEHLRSEVDNDLQLLDALRLMLPPYIGPAITVFRGDGFANRKRRTYGLSWSRDVEIAREFGSRGTWRTTRGGSVLLEASAPPDAVICEVCEADDDYCEKEIIIDRRRLRSVKVLERFSQLGIDEFRSQARSW
jgi:hypothetical protein